MTLKKKTESKTSNREINDIHQGDCVQLVNDKNLFQVIGIDISHEKCWLRKWPLVTSGSQVFEIEINQVIIPRT
tara:strand:+ start:1071 stop:1292 length:222 start_codon:yes stop_codon:yes gene_type:complete